MNSLKKGYTLIELVVALALLMLILFGGTALFTQNLRSEGLTEVDMSLNSSLRSILDELERVVRFGKIISVDEVDRTKCLTYGTNGYSGSTVRVENLQSIASDYDLLDGKISSISSQTEERVAISPSSIVINSFVITWFCQSGINDKINLEINASSTALGSGIAITKTVSRGIVLLNGSIN